MADELYREMDTDEGYTEIGLEGETDEEWIEIQIPHASERTETQMYGDHAIFYDEFIGTLCSDISGLKKHTAEKTVTREKYLGEE